MFWLLPDDNLEHELISPLPEAVAAEHSLRVWSKCGWTFVPTVREVGSSRDRCMACDQVAKMPGQSDYRADLVASAHLLEPHTCDPSIVLTLFAAIARISVTHLETYPLSAWEVCSLDQTQPLIGKICLSWIYTFACSSAAEGLDRITLADPAMDLKAIYRENAHEAITAAAPDFSTMDLSRLVASLAESCLEASDLARADVLLRMGLELHMLNDEETPMLGRLIALWNDLQARLHLLQKTRQRE